MDAKTFFAISAYFHLFEKIFFKGHVTSICASVKNILSVFRRTARLIQVQNL